MSSIGTLVIPTEVAHKASHQHCVKRGRGTGRGSLFVRNETQPLRTCKNEKTEEGLSLSVRIGTKQKKIYAVAKEGRQKERGRNNQVVIDILQGSHNQRLGRRCPGKRVSLEKHCSLCKDP